METIYILNNYRNSILDDPKGLQILSWLYLYGKSSDEEISKELNIPLNELASFLAKYFSSKLIKRDKDNRWYLSNFSKHAIFKTKVAEAINDSLIEDLKISDTDKKMFKIFINFDFDHNPYYLNTCHLTHHSNLNRFYIKNEETKEDFIQSLYSVIFGLNPFFKNHRSEDFLNFVVNQNSDEASFLNLNKEYFIMRLNQCRTDIDENNSYISQYKYFDYKKAKHPLISSSRLYCINRQLLDDDLEFYLKSIDDSKINLIKIVFTSEALQEYFGQLWQKSSNIGRFDIGLENDSVIEFTSQMIFKSYHNNMDNYLTDKFNFENTQIRLLINSEQKEKPQEKTKSKWFERIQKYILSLIESFRK